MKNKKIAIVMSSLGFGGAERVAVSYANWIAENTDDTVYILKFDSKESSYELNKKINVISKENDNCGKIGAIINRFKFLKNNFKEIKPDIIFAMFNKIQLYSYLTKSRKTKLIGSERCNIKERNIVDQIFSKLSAKLCDGYIFQTNDIKKYYPKKVVSNSIVIPNAISNKRIYEISEHSKKEKIVTAMGRLTSQKGFDVLIKAFCEVLKKHPEYKLVIYGEGEDREALEKIIYNQGVINSIILPGQKVNAIDEIAKSDIFVLSSRFEGMPNALIEAMATGTACISTDCEFGPRDLITDGVNGLLVPVENPDKLAKQIIYLMENPEIRIKLANNASKLKEKLDQEVIYKNYYDYFTKIFKQKRILAKIKEAILNPSKLILYIDKKMSNKLLSDEMYLKLQYKNRIGKKLDLKNPKGFNEKIQWLKLHDKNPMYTNLVDKIKVRDFIKEKIGEEYLIPIYGIYDKFEDIDFDKLPNQFVIKCNHDSGGVYICKDKKKFDYDKAKSIIEGSLSKNYFYNGREWPYKNVIPKIVIEQYMEDDEKKELVDYKFMCFDGEPQVVFACTERYKKGLKVTFFDINWNKLPFERHYPSSKVEIEKPKNYDKMIEFAKILSKNIPFVRVDFYEINGDLYFGELTFYPGSGLEEFNPEEWDIKLGDMIKLPKEQKR